MPGDSVTGDHSFKHGFFPIKVQYLKSPLKRILVSSVAMVLAFGARGHMFDFCPDLLFLPFIYSFVSLFVRIGEEDNALTLFVRL